MNNLFSCFVLVLVSLGAVLVNADYSSKVSATVGKSLALNFDYKGPTYARYYFLKNGRYFRADRRRVFERLGRIYFSKVLAWDAGVYRMIVRDVRSYNRIYYNKAITLTGEHHKTSYSYTASCSTIATYII